MSVSIAVVSAMDDNSNDHKIDGSRRRFLGAAGAGVLAGAIGSLLLPSRHAISDSVSVVRWGIVGTGSIANAMARRIKAADRSAIAAISSRRMATAVEFAETHAVPKAFDDWAEMCAWDGVDAIYVATPTSVREEICLAAARNRKHVLGEKPFASLPSVKRITAACREYDVAFMDGTHFVHHPRTHFIRETAPDALGRVWSVASAFQFNLPDRSNIRYNTNLEPMGAIGDAGWYNMRAAAEYLSADARLDNVVAQLRRDAETGAAIAGSGLLQMSDGATSTWNCGFDSGGVVMDLRITGQSGVYSVDDFLSQNPDGSADLVYRSGGWGSAPTSQQIPSDKPGATLMFENFAEAAADPAQRERWMLATERTQALLDAAWAAALQNESG